MTSSSAPKSSPFLYIGKQVLTAILAALVLSLSPASFAQKSPDASGAVETSRSESQYSESWAKLTNPPQNSKELLNNIKFAIDNNLFFDDEIFRDDEKLWRLLGGMDFSKNFPMSATRKNVHISNFPETIDGLKFDVNTPHYLWFTVIINKQEEKVFILLNNSRGLGISITDFEKIFGKTRVPAPIKRIEPLGPMPADSIINFRTIKYKLSEPSKSYAYAIADFYPDEILASVEILLEGDKK